MDEQQEIIDDFKALKSSKISVDIKKELMDSLPSFDVEVIKEITKITDKDRSYLRTAFCINHKSSYKIVRRSLKESMFIYFGLTPDSFLYKCMDVITESKGGLLIIDKNNLETVLLLNGKKPNYTIQLTIEQAKKLIFFSDRLEETDTSYKYHFHNQRQ